MFRAELGPFTGIVVDGMLMEDGAIFTVTAARARVLLAGYYPQIQPA